MKQPTVHAGARTPERSVQAEPVKLLRRIGSTTYEVTVYFSKTSRESMEDKILRLIRNEMAGGKAAGL